MHRRSFTIESLWYIESFWTFKNIWLQTDLSNDGCQLQNAKSLDGVNNYSCTKANWTILIDTNWPRKIPDQWFLTRLPQQLQDCLKGVVERKEESTCPAPAGCSPDLPSPEVNAGLSLLTAQPWGKCRLIPGQVFLPLVSKPCDRR